jgi:hypothetical protein
MILIGKGSVLLAYLEAPSNISVISVRTVWRRRIALKNCIVIGGHGLGLKSTTSTIARLISIRAAEMNCNQSPLSKGDLLRVLIGRYPVKSLGVSE